MPHYKIELSHHPRTVCGVDEAGCGPWAGPVVAAAVYFPDRKVIPRGLNDSKQLQKEDRQKLADKLRARPEIQIGVGIATVEEIDILNIWWATALAMERAVAALATLPELALIDGNRKPRNMLCEIQTLIGGDAISYSIAAASIIAKTTRDQMMADYAALHPQYGFEKHAGYGTPQHQAALKTHGPCAIHRRSFKPIQAFFEAA